MSKKFLHLFTAALFLTISSWTTSCLACYCYCYGNTPQYQGWYVIESNCAWGCHQMGMDKSCCQVSECPGTTAKSKGNITGNEKGITRFDPSKIRTHSKKDAKPLK